MDLTPQAVADAQFRIVRKGYDPEQVRPLLAQAAESLRNLEARATAAERRISEAEARATDAERRALEADARAKAALQAASAAQEAAEDPDRVRRAILAAQKTADTIVAEATAEAEKTRNAAREEAKKITTDARAAAARMVADAEQAARAAHAAEIERTKADMAELSSLRDQLRRDAEFLSAHLTTQRQRVADSIEALQAVLASPTALKPLPVPEKGDPTAASAAKKPAAPASGSSPGGTATATASRPAAAPPPEGEIATAGPPASGAPSGSSGSSGSSAPAGPSAAGSDATAPDEASPSAAADDADSDVDVAGELASLAEGGDPAEAFFAQTEPFRDDRWQRGS